MTEIPQHEMRMRAHLLVTGVVSVNNFDSCQIIKMIGDDAETCFGGFEAEEIVRDEARAEAAVRQRTSVIDNFPSFDSWVDSDDEDVPLGQYRQQLHDGENEDDVVLSTIRDRLRYQGIGDDACHCYVLICIVICYCHVDFHFPHLFITNLFVMTVM
jgi:hypothetical protein